jgi:hypothetical protein
MSCASSGHITKLKQSIMPFDIYGYIQDEIKKQSPCSHCMHRPVTSWGNVCSTCIHQPVMHRDHSVYYNLYAVMSQAIACTYCMGSKVSSLSRIYLSPATLLYFHDLLDIQIYLIFQIYMIFWMYLFFWIFM